MFKIGKRSFLTFIKRVFEIENYLAIVRFFNVHKKPFNAVFNEIFSLGKYPKLLHFNSPIGSAKANLYSKEGFKKEFDLDTKYRLSLDLIKTIIKNEKNKQNYYSRRNYSQ